MAVRAREMQRVGIRGMASGSVLRGRGSEEKEWLLGQPFEAEAEGRKTGGRQSVNQFAHASAKSLSKSTPVSSQHTSKSPGTSFDVQKLPSM